MENFWRKCFIFILFFSFYYILSYMDQVWAKYCTKNVHISDLLSLYWFTNSSWWKDLEGLERRMGCQEKENGLDKPEIWGKFIRKYTNQRLFWLVSTILVSLSRKLFCVCIYMLYTSRDFNFKWIPTVTPFFPIPL